MPQRPDSTAHPAFLLARQPLLQMGKDICVIGILSCVFLLGLSAVAPRYATHPLHLISVCSILISSMLRVCLGLYGQSQSFWAEMQSVSANAAAIAAQAEALSDWPRVGAK